MTNAERIARNLIAAQSTERLLEQWELTTESKDPNIYRVRGWLMDEIEKRCPEGFDRWLETENTDESLREYIMG